MSNSVPIYSVPVLNLRVALYRDGEGYSFQEKDAVCFPHIPKTAGTSFASFLATFFSASEIIPLPEQLGYCDEWSEEVWKKYRLLMSGRLHFDAAFANVPSAHFVTFFREPVSRIVSLYRYFRRPHPYIDSLKQPNARWAKNREIAKKYSFDEWVLESARAYSYERNQALALVACGSANLNAADPSEVKDHLERAKDILRNQFCFVGITEEFARSKALFSRTFGLPDHYGQAQERLNAAPESEKGDSPSSTALDQVREDNWADIELYEYACNLFHERCRDLLDSESSNPASMERRGQPYVAITPANMRGSGMYREEIRDADSSHRWTGAAPETCLNFSADLPVSGQLTVKIQIAFAINELALESLDVVFNDQPALQTSKMASEGKFVIESRFAICEEWKDLELQSLILRCYSERPPAPENGGPSDERTLGVAIEKVELRLCQ